MSFVVPRAVDSQFEENLLAACEEVLEVTSKLTQVLEQRRQSVGSPSLSADEQEDLQQIVYATSTIVRLAQEWSDSEPVDEVLLGLVTTLAKKLRKSVLLYVPATKALLGNVMDYLCQQQHRTADRAVERNTRGLWAIVEILHRQRLRANGISFGRIDQMDANSILLVKTANHLTAEAGAIISLALQGDPLEILESSDQFILAMERLIEMVEMQELSDVQDRVHLLSSQEQAIMALSQEAARAHNPSSGVSMETVTERASTISSLIVDESIELVISDAIQQQQRRQGFESSTPTPRHSEEVEDDLNETSPPRSPSPTPDASPSPLSPPSPPPESSDAPRRPQQPLNRNRSGKLVRNISKSFHDTGIVPEEPELPSLEHAEAEQRLVKTLEGVKAATEAAEEAAKASPAPLEGIKIRSRGDLKESKNFTASADTETTKKSRSIRMDYKRKYGIKPSYENKLQASVNMQRPSARDLAEHARFVSTPTPQRESHPQSNLYPSQDRFSTKRSKRGFGDVSAVRVIKQSKKKRQWSLRLRPDSRAKEPVPEKPTAIQPIEASSDVTEKLDQLFDQVSPPVSPVSSSGNVRQPTSKKSKRRKKYGKSMPDGAGMGRFNSSSADPDDCGAPVTRTFTTFKPYMANSEDIPLPIGRGTSPNIVRERSETTPPMMLLPTASESIERVVIPPVQPSALAKKSTDEKLQVALQATMAASVPLVIDLFRTEFGWFSKEWDRLPMSSKMKFTAKMRNQLTQMHPISSQAPRNYSTPATLRPIRKQGSFTPLNSPSFLVQQKREEKQLESMMVPLSSKVRWLHRSASMNHLLTQEAAAILQQSKTSLHEHIECMEKNIHTLLRAEPTTPVSSPPTVGPRLTDTVAAIYQVLTQIVKVSTEGADNKIVRQMSVPTLEFLSNANTQSEADEGLMAKLKETHSYPRVCDLITNLRLNIYDKLLDLGVLRNQAIQTLSHVDMSLQKINHLETLHLLASARRLVETIELLLKQVATYTQVQNTFTEERCRKREKLALPKPYFEQDIWEYQPSPNESLQRASLDYSLLKIVRNEGPEEEVEMLERAILLTYREFCSPSILVKKIQQCFSVPESVGLAEEAARDVQVRVCGLLNKLIQLQFASLPKKLLADIATYAKETIQPSGLETEAEVILQTLAKQTAQQEQKQEQTHISVLNPQALGTNSTALFYEMFLEADEQCIANQLTLFDFEIFRRIQHGELINQAWNRNRYLAANVVDYITRLNHVSYWVPSLILWSEKLKQRSQVLAKFIRIGHELLRLKNYNTLMGLVAGLNMSSITRLRLTRELLTEEQSTQLTALVELMDSRRSFNNYRAHIAQAERPIIPYLGLYLTDLTFIEESGPSQTGDLINLKKQCLVAQVLTQIKFYQEVPYDIQPDQDLGPYVKKLSSLDDEGLYQLSLSREPPHAASFDIL